MFENDVSMKLLEKLFATYEAERRRRRGAAPAAVPFSIAISREAGARGRSVAAAVGRQLSWPVYDREILDKIAENLRLSPGHVEKVDERPVGWLEDCLSGLVAQTRVAAGTYLKHLVGVVRGLGLIGHCVVVGRGANHVLPPESTLRVRLVADLPDRIKVTAARYRMTEKEAAHKTAKTDIERTAFVRSNFHVNPAAPEHYDLVLNTSRLSDEECATMIVAMLRLF